MELRFAFRILGPTWERRRLVDAGAAFQGYASCDPRAETDREAYLSAFCYGDDFRRRADASGFVDTKDFTGPCWSPWLWLDIDRAGDLGGALMDARRLTAFSLDRFRTLDDEDLLLFFSGSKGFHVSLPTALWEPEPSPAFHRVSRRLAECIADAAGVAIDAGVYDKVRAFRAPNSRHPGTGRYKRRLSHDELMRLPIDRIAQLAEQPEPFDIPAPPARDRQAAADWLDAERRVRQQAEGKAQRRVAGDGAPTLNRLTLEFIRAGAEEGDRHRLLFSAAANLAEFGCPPALAHALLTESALDSGLPPKEVHRQIECGLNAVKGEDSSGR
jgi:hypothetical protein